MLSEIDQARLYELASLLRDTACAPALRDALPNGLSKRCAEVVAGAFTLCGGGLPVAADSAADVLHELRSAGLVPGTALRGFGGVPVITATVPTPPFGSRRISVYLNRLSDGDRPDEQAHLVFRVRPPWRKGVGRLRRLLSEADVRWYDDVNAVQHIGGNPGIVAPGIVVRWAGQRVNAAARNCVDVSTWWQRFHLIDRVRSTVPAVEDRQPVG